VGGRHLFAAIIALLLPGVARRFPFSAVLWTLAGSHFAAGRRLMGRFHMTIKASARSALIFAAGLWVGFAGSLPAMAAGTDTDSATVSNAESATTGKSSRQGSHSQKKQSAHRKSTRAASKSAESQKTEEKQVADANGGASPATPSGTSPAIPEWLANANAQMTAADAPSDSAKAMSAAMSEKANTVLQSAADKPADTEAPADAGVVASDQLNDVDRALQETPSSETPATRTVAIASTSRAASEIATQAASNDSSTLDKTSLIGKIFIAFGALLTVASAARMFMA
jgi:hypothetical protein